MGGTAECTFPDPQTLFGGMSVRRLRLPGQASLVSCVPNATRWRCLSSRTAAPICEAHHPAVQQNCSAGCGAPMLVGGTPSHLSTPLEIEPKGLNVKV